MANKTKTTNHTGLKSNVTRLTHAHFFYAAILALQIMMYDAWKLITPEFVLRRWLITALLLVVTTIVWLMARVGERSEAAYRRLVYALIVADIFVASLNVYTQRGMASKAVLLYAVPIVASAVLMRRTVVFATALLSAAAYMATAMLYFTVYFNEGYKIELYGETGFYSVVFLLLASLLWVVIRTKQKR